jgi:hypothetical protein
MMSVVDVFIVVMVGSREAPTPGGPIRQLVI